MIKHLLQAHSLHRIYNQTLPYEVFGIGTQTEMTALFWELKNSSFNLFICVFDFLRFERRSSAKHSIENNSD